MAKNKAFTLLELLVVIAIIAVFVSVLFPVFARAKRTAKATVSISNLRQCYLAATLYGNDNGGMLRLPRDANIAGIFVSAPTCDPLDTWRANCSQAWGFPLVGSYAYAGYILQSKVFTTSWASWLLLPRFPLMVDTFIADTRLDPFKGTHSTFPPDRHPDPMPNRWLSLYSDGSVKMDHYSQKMAQSKGYEGFGWPEVFDDSCVQGGMTEHQCSVGGIGP